jgi:hypothetical protein
MSTKRILGIALFGVLFIATVFGVMLLTLFLKQESDAVALPDVLPAVEIPGYIEPDTLDRVEVNKDTIQAVVSMTLSRPGMYSRDVVIKSFWEDGQAEYNISVSVWNGITSLRTLTAMGIEKRVIITPNQLYIWYKGDREPYIGNLGSSGDGYRNADEWQMLVTYEDLLQLDKNDISEAGYVEYGGEECVYAVYRSPLLNYTRTFYISLDIGLVIGAEEIDEAGELVYSMTAGECIINEIDPSAFILPDGTNLK